MPRVGVTDTSRMDVTAAISNLQSSQLASEVSTEVARKSLDAAKQQGAAVISLLEAAKVVADNASPSVDASVRGATFDVVV